MSLNYGINFKTDRQRERQMYPWRILPSGVKVKTTWKSRYVTYCTWLKYVNYAWPSALCMWYVTLYLCCNRIILSLNVTVSQDSDRKTVADPGSLRGRLRQPQRGVFTYYFEHFFPKTTCNWKWDWTELGTNLPGPLGSANTKTA